MKCIVYAIKLDGPVAGDSALGDYSESTSRHGMGSQLNSILASANRFLLHVLEGKSHEVDNLYKNIVKNDKSGKVIELINAPIDRRSFAKHPAVVPSKTLRKELALFLYHNQDIFSGLCSLKRNILLEFGVLKKKIKERTISITLAGKSKLQGSRPTKAIKKTVTRAQKAKYKGSHLALSGWVNLKTKHANADDEILGLSLRAKLLYGNHLFEDLVAAGSFGTEQQIIEILEECNASGSLLIEKGKETVAESQEKKKTKRKSKFGSSFYNKINKWLN